MARLDKGSLNIERIHLIQHALNQALDRVFGRAERAQAWYAQCAACTAEDEIAPSLAGLYEALAEVGQRELDDVERAPEIGFELVADFEFVLVLAGADDAVAGAVDDDVDARPVRDAGFHDRVDGLPDTDVTEKGQVVLAGRDGREGVGRRGRRSWGSGSGKPGVHGWDRVSIGAANSGYQVAVGKRGFDNGTANMACGSKHLINRMSV